MRYLYTFLLYLLTPFLLLRLYWKGRRLPLYRERILERFSLATHGLSEVDVWIHAVSLGEVVAAIPLIEACLLKEWRVLVTTMTPTGSTQVMKRFGGRVSHQYLPYDLPWVLRRFFKTIRARVGIIMETELWPNLIHEAAHMHLPLLTVNARISDKAFGQYKKATWLFKPILNELTAILAQSELDAERFIALGASPDLVQVVGNMKFDLHIEVPANDDLLQLKAAWGTGRTVFIAASTHDDEEKQLLSRLNVLQAAIPGALLLIAPRHPERFQTVYELALSLGYRTGRRSDLPTVNADIEVVILDSMGELLSFYKMSDIAFVGGSLVPIGGHNVLEPIAVEVPVFCGPFMQNSKAISDELLSARAMVMVRDADELIAEWIAMCQDPSVRLEQISRASDVLLANQGTVSRYMEKISAVLASTVR